MLSSWREVAVFLDASGEGERIGRQAAGVARDHEAHLIAVYGVEHAREHPHDSFVRGNEAIRDLMARRREEEERKVLLAGRRVEQISREYDVDSEFRVVWRDPEADKTVLRTLHCDLIVVAHPRLPGLPDGWSAERLLLNSGMPVLRIPSSWEGPIMARHVVIAWNRSREARRAINDAMPFICAAKTVTVLVVDPHELAEHAGHEPGSDLQRHLQRHDVTAEIEYVPSHGTPVGEVILGQADRRDADLLVVGAYSRPRATEMLFGGVTRFLLAQGSLPLLLSR